MPKAEHFHALSDEEGEVYWARQLAPPEAIDMVLNGDRSPWYWFRLPDGDLVLGLYPQEGPGGTYTATEQWREI